MAPDESPLDVLKRMRVRSGASLAECSQALKAAQGDARAALNALAEEGHTGGRPGYDAEAPPGTYGFDAYAERVIDTCARDIRATVTPGAEPIRAVVLHAQQGIPVRLVLLYTGATGMEGQPWVSLDVSPAFAPIPSSQDAEDPLLETFRYRHGFQETRPDVGLFDEEPELAWEESSLPDLLFSHDMLRAASGVARALAAAGYGVAPDCAVAYARADLRLSDAEDQWARVRRQMQALFTGQDAVRAFAELCYAGDEARRRVEALARGG
ncbi:hypothetical protein DRW03_15840 [Corallococcus sp. H22C18031201]|uniref:hypothetical protein n=1 Tax=Citreicoccus inhibens TaxID=2849499 RepID=UPI000E750EF9|nr:hypothetical protein [Citreicoccus inhibens]MBU8899857.1 hypothetical protein [Citreicoccus inhibens]RJS21810.1 hypothetical protein DRW03_15840 [Corallococcus sp. H22C18031201]